MKRLRIKTANLFVDIEGVPAWLAFAALIVLATLLLSGVWVWS